MSAKPYTMDDVQAWVEMLWERERLDEMTMARIRATVEERDELRAQVDAEHARGVAEERARIVAWLRERTRNGLYPTTRGSFVAVADAIERGEHVTEDAHG